MVFVCLFCCLSFLHLLFVVVCFSLLLDYIFITTPTATPKLVLEDIEANANEIENEEEDDPVPSAPPLSPPTPRIYPILPENSSDLMKTPQAEQTPMQTTPTASPFPASRSDFNMQRGRRGGGVGKWTLIGPLMTILYRVTHSL